MHENLFWTRNNDSTLPKPKNKMIRCIIPSGDFSPCFCILLYRHLMSIIWLLSDIKMALNFTLYSSSVLLTLFLAEAKILLLHMCLVYQNVCAKLKTTPENLSSLDDLWSIKSSILLHYSEYSNCLKLR